MGVCPYYPIPIGFSQLAFDFCDQFGFVGHHSLSVHLPEWLSLEPHSVLRVMIRTVVAERELAYSNHGHERCQWTSCPVPIVRILNVGTRMLATSNRLTVQESEPDLLPESEMQCFSATALDACGPIRIIGPMAKRTRNLSRQATLDEIASCTRLFKRTMSGGYRGEVQIIPFRSIG